MRVEYDGNAVTLSEPTKVNPVTQVKMIREQLQEAKGNPLSLYEFGQDAVAKVSALALRSLRTSMQPAATSMPTKNMADFLERFSEAKEIVERESTPRLTTLPAVIEPSGWLFSRWGRQSSVGQDVKELKSLADADKLAFEAGKILEDMIPSLDEMVGSLKVQLRASFELANLYEEVGGQLDLLFVTGMEVLKEWRAEATLNKTGVQADGSVDEEPFYIGALADRLEFLEQLGHQINGHSSTHKINAKIEQRQQQAVSTLRGQNLPIILEKVATFIRQLQQLQRASVINGLANTTREAAIDENTITALAVQKTATAIENLACSTRDALSAMNSAADEITAQLMDANPNLAVQSTTSGVSISLRPG